MKIYQSDFIKSIDHMVIKKPSTKSYSTVSSIDNLNITSLIDTNKIEIQFLKDRLRLSDFTGEREDKINEIKENIQKDYYSSDSVLDALTQTLIDFKLI